MAAGSAAEPPLEDAPASDAPPPEAPAPLPALPAPRPLADAAAGPRSLEVGGPSVALDSLGPVIVGEDGSLRRIANWEALSERERANTLRLIGKRNQARLASLREGQGGQEGRQQGPPSEQAPQRREQAPPPPDAAEL